MDTAEAFGSILVYVIFGVTATVFIVEGGSPLQYFCRNS